MNFNYIAYETNITSISNLVSNKFYYQNENGEIDCFLKKTKLDPLIFLCRWYYNNLMTEPTNINYLGELTNEIILYNSSFKYNFYIPPINNSETFIVNRYDHAYLPTTRFVFPTILDFHLKEIFTINYFISYATSENIGGITFNPDSGSLLCHNVNNKILRCNVERKHFENKKSGLYYTYHIMLGGGLTKFYEFSPIQVIIPDNKIYIKLIKDSFFNNYLGKKIILNFNTNYDDNETNLFNEEVTFSTTTYDYRGENIFEINCKSWKPHNENIKFICYINQSLESHNYYLYLKDAIFNYKNYTIVVFCFNELSIYPYDYYFPFLYSDKQIINVKEQEEPEKEYNLNFNIEIYNNEDLILYSIQNGLYYTKLDKCNIIKKTLNCKINKKSIEEILTINNDQFKVMAIHEDFGIIYLDFIFNITINYDIINREDIFVGITDILNSNTEIGVPIVFRTNITSIKDLTSSEKSILEGNCHFKKTIINPLYLICSFKEGYRANIVSLDKELILDNIHYKYNFRIQPFYINTAISVSYYNYGTIIYLTYPIELNFKYQNSLIIKFIVGVGSGANNIRFIYSDSSLNDHQSSLDCKSLYKVKVCNVSISHFSLQNYREIGYCNIYHPKIDYGVSPIKVVLPLKILNIEVGNTENYNTQFLCQNGIIKLITNYNDTESNIFNIDDIEEKTLFKITLKTTNSIDNQTKFDLNCRLWKPKNQKLIIICHSDKNLKITEEKLVNAYFNDTAFNYNGYRIVIISNTYLSFRTLKSNCPFLYSDEQMIKVKEEMEFYELNFKIDTYINEPLFLSASNLNYIYLNNCLKKEKFLVCTIEKEKIFEQGNSQIFKVYYLNEIYGLQKFDLIQNIIFSFDIQKQNIYVGITKLKESIVDFNNSVPYETNITTISKVTTDYFFLDENKTINCYFKKAEIENLLILCRWPFNGSYSLGEIKNEIVLENINNKYNFRIQPVVNNELVTVGGIGSKVLFSFPQLLDFYLDDKLAILIQMESPENSNNISLDSKSSYLICENSLSFLTPYKRCFIDKNYFIEQQNPDENYYLYHINHLNKSSKFYELSPIQVKLPKYNEIIIRIRQEDNINQIKIGINGVLYFKTDYYDNEKIIFNDTEIENIFLPETKIIDENKNEYNVECRFWNPKNEKIRIICNLNQNLKYSIQNIKLKDISFNLNGNHIYIYSISYIEVNQVNFNISFLYSDKQFIKIVPDIESYNLVFNIDSYNNDILFLHSTKNNYLLLKNCQVNNKKQLNCIVLRQNLDELISTDNDVFTIGAINDNIGVYIFHNILPIQFSHDYTVQKIDLYIELVKSFGLNSEIGLPFGFETNITEIENFISEKYDNCYFKKIELMPLLYVCELDKEQIYNLRINSETYIKNKHWKYNFIIQPYYKNDNFNIKGYGEPILFIYPEILDFSNEESLTINFIISDPSLSQNIKLNSESTSLECQNLDGMKKCIVSLAHFRGKSNNYYYIYYSNYFGEQNIYYSLPRIKVVLPQIN